MCQTGGQADTGHSIQYIPSEIGGLLCAYAEGKRHFNLVEAADRKFADSLKHFLNRYDQIFNQLEPLGRNEYERDILFFRP